MADRDVLTEIGGMGPEELLQYLRTHPDLSEEEVNEIKGYVAEVVPKGTFSSPVPGQPTATDWAPVQDALGNLEGNREAEDEAKGVATDLAYQTLTQARQTGTPANLEQIEGMAPESLDPAAKQRWAQDVLDQARDRVKEDVARETGRDESDQSVEQEVDQLASRAGNTPRWILDPTTGYGPLTEEEKRRAVEFYNDLYGTTYTNFDRDLAPRLAENVAGGGPTQRNHMIIEAAKLDVEPLTTFTITLPGVRTKSKGQVTLTEDEMNVLRSTYGLSNDAIARTVRLAAVHTGDPENVPWQALVALAAASGHSSAIAASAKAAQDAERQRERERVATQSDRLLPSGESQGVVARRAIEARARDGIQPTSLQQVQATSRSSTSSAVTRLLMSYEEGLEAYQNSPVLAFIHAMDRGLASRVAMTGGDPRKLSGADNAKALRLLREGGLVNRGTSPFEQLGGSSGDSVLRTLGDYFTAFGPEEPEDVPEEPKRQLPDPVAVQENLRQLWQAIFRTEPSQEVQQAFAQDLNRILGSAPLEQSIDISARIQQFIRSQPLYEQLYGNKPSGIPEEEWIARNLDAVSSILGEDISEDALRAGMTAPGSNYQTAVGAASMSVQAKDNSNWLGRLARAAQIFGNET